MKTILARSAFILFILLLFIIIIGDPFAVIAFSSFVMATSCAIWSATYLIKHWRE